MNPYQAKNQPYKLESQEKIAYRLELKGNEL